jgi:hypothetical protein
MSEVILFPQKPTWRPWGNDVTSLPFAKVTTDTHREIAAAYQEWHHRREIIDKLTDAYQKARQTALLAREALEAEQAREIETGTIGKSAELKLKLEQLQRTAHEGAHLDRVKAAEVLARQAHEAFLSAITDHEDELLTELRQDAEKIADDWNKAQASVQVLQEKIEAITAPLYARHSEIQERVNSVISRTEPFTPVQTEPGTPPFPDAEQFAARELFLNPPEPEPVVEGGVGWVEKPVAASW